MTDIYLIEATPEYAEQVWQFRQEIFDCDKDSESQFAGCLSLDEAASAGEWIQWCQLRKSESNCRQTGVDVPLTTLLYAKVTIDWSVLSICAIISITLFSELGAVIVVIQFAPLNEDTVMQRKCCA